MSGTRPETALRGLHSGWDAEAARVLAAFFDGPRLCCFATHPLSGWARARSDSALRTFVDLLLISTTDSKASLKNALERTLWGSELAIEVR